MIEPLIREAFRAAWESDSRTQTPQGHAETEDQVAARIRLDLQQIPRHAVLVTRGFADDNAARRLVDALAAFGRRDILVVDLDLEDHDAVLDENAMRAAGWVRADA